MFEKKFKHVFSKWKSSISDQVFVLAALLVEKSCFEVTKIVKRIYTIIWHKKDYKLNLTTVLKIKHVMVLKKYKNS